MAGFGYTERPENIQDGLQTWADHVVGLMDTLEIPRAHLVGNSFGSVIGLRIATQHTDRVGKLVLMGSMGVPFLITEGLQRVWGYEPSFENMQGPGRVRYSRGIVNDELAEVRYRGSIQPGFQESYVAMFPAPRQRWVEAMSIPEEDEIRQIPHRALLVHGRRTGSFRWRPRCGCCGGSTTPTQRVLPLRTLVNDRAFQGLQPAVREFLSDGTAGDFSGQE